MTIHTYPSVHSIPFTASYTHETKLLYRTRCTPYLIRNSGSYHKRTCRFKYSKHLYSESLTSRELGWLEPDKSCSCDFFEVVLHDVISPRVTIKDLQVKAAAALSIPIPDLGVRLQLLVYFLDHNKHVQSVFF